MSAPRYERSPAPSAVGFAMHRRTVMKGLIGAAGLAAVPGLAACGTSKSSSGGSSGGTDTKTITFGSNYSDKNPKAALEAMLKAFEDKSGDKVVINAVDHGAFQKNIQNYLQTRPDDVFAWFAGYRMQYFAKQGLAGDISDVWTKIGGDFSDALKQASTLDGKQYFVPLYNYPWAVFFRKSVFTKGGYEAPKTWDDFIALMTKMKKDGLAPLSFADKDGWPALGTFDYLNMRLNGYQFHIDLCAGKTPWTDPKVAAVFDHWKQLIPFYEPGFLGRTWEEGAHSLQEKKSAMYVLGSFVSTEFTEPNRADLDFFTFPEMDPSVGTDAIEAPIDGFMMARKPKNEVGAKKLLEYIGTADAELAYNKVDPSNLGTSSKYDTSGYSDFQKKCAKAIGDAKHISQFFDRDSNPQFVDQFIPAIQKFFNNPGDIQSILTSLEGQRKSIFTN